MKIKPWAVAGVMSLLLSTTGCGTAGNAANTGNAAGFLGTVVTPTVNVIDLRLKPVVRVDSTKRTIHLQLHDTARDGVNAANVGAAPVRNTGLHIAVPTSWTVEVSGANSQVASSVAIVSYQSGGGAGTRIAHNLGTSFRVTTPGQYAVVAVVPGRPDRTLSIITVSNGVNQPTIVPHSF